MKNFFVILLGAILVITFPAHASEATTARFVYQVVSDAPVNDVDEWIVSIAPGAVKWTSTHNIELCGVIARSKDNRLGIVLGTTESPASCGFSHKNVPEGFVSTGETFHTHPPKLSLQQIRQHGKFQIAHNNFSGTDYFDGPGYVATRSMLLHQAGYGTRRVISSW